MRSSWRVAVVAAAVLVSVSACSGAGQVGEAATPAATVTVTASPSGTPEPTATTDELASVDTVVVSSAGLSLRRGDVELAAVDVVAMPLDDAVELLTRVLGEPREAGVEGDHCLRAQTRWGWGDGTYLGTPDLYTDEGALTFTTKDTAIETDDGRSVRLQTPGGIAVGDPVAPLAETTDPALVDDFSADPSVPTLALVYDLVRADEISGDEVNPYGASVQSVDGVVEVIRGASFLRDYC
jgi:hypothetical protein